MFAEGTLDSRTFGFPKLDRVVEGRHGNYRREDGGSAHNATDSDGEVCTPDSEEFYRRIEDLRCNEEYMRAVREEIERSYCVNEVFDPDTNGYDEDSDICVVIDERDDVNMRCSVGCATNQADYLTCKYIGEERVEVFRDCGLPEYAEVLCRYNDKGFCGAEPFGASNLPTIYEECFEENNMNASICSDECKEALEFMVDEQGCCTNTYFLIPLGVFHNDVGIVTLSKELFSACGIEIPEVCKRFPPPEEFLECARDMDDDKDGGVDDDKDGDVDVSPTIICSIVLVMVSLFSTV